MNKNKKSDSNGTSIIIFFIFLYIVFNFIVSYMSDNSYKNNTVTEHYYDEKVFSIITTPDNKAMEETIMEYADKNDIKMKIDYADNLEIVNILNSGQKYDAIWSSNSVWLDMLDSSIVKTSNLKSTSITPIVFGVKESKARELGLIDKKVTMNDLLSFIEKGSLTFSMANPIMTNSGASAYFNILATLAGNPEVLKMEHLENENLKSKMKSFFTGLERTSGDEDFLEESFLNGDYDAAVTYESSIININKKLVKMGKEPLYLIYPVDGVSISDSPLVFVNNGVDSKKQEFLDFQEFVLSDSGQKSLASLGRRTWYGGVTNNADKNLFNPDWGIDTSKYISSVKYPSKEVIIAALNLYQTEFRKPVHVVFCLDYSGSMFGEGIDSLRDSMDYIFGEKATLNLIQFSKYDKIDIILFNNNLYPIGTFSGDNYSSALEVINNETPTGGTALYPSVEKALNMLKDESGDYNLSVIVMTDGEGNIGSFNDVSDAYYSLNREIPIYSITFANASEEQLNMLSDLSNGKVFDGRTDLLNAFKAVRGYN